MKIEDYNKYYIQGSDHYLIPKDEFKELFNEMINWKEESQRQKEVINKITDLIKQYGKYDGEKCTRGFQMWSADFNKILDILNEVSE
jgi:hypothetical protein